MNYSVGIDEFRLVKYISFNLRYSLDPGYYLNVSEKH